MRRLACLVVLSAAVVATGCKDKKSPDKPLSPEAEDTSFAEDGTDSSAADTDTQLVASSLVTASPGSEVRLANELPAYVRPRCVTRAPADMSATEVTFTFDNCQGRNGLRDVSGVIVARAEVPGPRMLKLFLTFTALKVNGAVIDGSAAASIDAEGVERSMSWSATLDGTTTGGKKFTYQSDHTVTWTLGGTCFAVEGSANGTVRDRSLKTEIAGFRRCGRGCPDAGGKITVTNTAKNKQTTLEYDGTNRATFTGPNGKTTVVPLLCKP